jgi:hypothetical protein
MKHVRIESSTERLGPCTTTITNAESGETIHGVMDIDIHIGIMEVPVATMKVWTEFDGMARPHWKPVFENAGRCASCEHWSCDAGATFGECTKIPEGQYKVGQSAYASDPSGIMGALMTTIDFGCVLWEPKDEPA